MTHFIDLQVNGYAGVDFNDDQLAAESLHAVCRRLRADGVEGILATIITAAVPQMEARLRNLVQLRDQDPLARELVLGVHLEGPFVSDAPGFVGAHPPDHARPADEDVMNRLLDAAEGLVRLVTLAPERDPGMRVTKLLRRAGVVVAAGHCDPSLADLRAAIDAGLAAFTHLGNGCPAMLPRHDNVIQRVLSLADKLWVSFIADGVHVPWHALGNYLRCVGIDHAVVVSDAISAAGLGAGRFRLGDQEVVVDADGATWSADRSHLTGSAATMAQAATRLRDELGLSSADVVKLTRDNPLQMLGPR